VIWSRASPRGEGCQTITKRGLRDLIRGSGRGGARLRRVPPPTQRLVDLHHGNELVAVRPRQLDVRGEELPLRVQHVEIGGETGHISKLSQGKCTLRRRDQDFLFVPHPPGLSMCDHRFPILSQEPSVATLVVAVASIAVTGARRKPPDSPSQPTEAAR